MQHSLAKTSFKARAGRILSILIILATAISCLACTKKQVYYPGRDSMTGVRQQQTTIIKATKYKRKHYVKGNVNDTLESFYQHWQGTPYVLGGMSRSGIDCSAFTYLAYRDLFTIELPRTVSQQAGEGRRISKKALQPGDLVFFKTGFFQKHVGIYMGSLSFMHVSTIKGVMISRLDDDYWRNKYWKSRRLL